MKEIEELKLQLNEYAELVEKREKIEKRIKELEEAIKEKFFMQEASSPHKINIEL